ncbi:NUDIX domain-containing protein [Micromonospora mangrovi]|uniref:NUDIX domain-containing protein n=2 Tax=Micromonospora TaxID=1873 RepID=A0AAU8HIU6_9ACTN
MALSPYIARMRARIGPELLLLPGVSGIVRDDAGRLLLVRRSDNGRWSLPAGVVDPGEQPADALLREIHEETGVQATIERVGGVATHPVVYPNGDVCEYLNVWFRCRAVGGTPTADGDESLEVGWFAPDDLPALDDWARLRIDTTADADAPTWYARPGERHPALGQPDAL